MASLHGDTNKYEDGEGAPILEAYHSATKALMRRKFEESKQPWSSFVFGSSYASVTSKEIAEIDRQVLESGYRFTSSAMISALERPEAYLPIPGSEGNPDEFTFEHSDAVVMAPDGKREQRGQGDNVVEYKGNAIGVAKYFRSSQYVADALANGVPPAAE